MTRPLSVTLISLVLIFSGLITFGATVYAATSPDLRALTQTFYDSLNEEALVALPMDLHLAFAVANALLIISTGVFMLRGANWARLLYLSLGVFGILQNLVTYGPSLIILINVGVYCVFFYFLVRRKTLDFFCVNKR